MTWWWVKITTINISVQINSFADRRIFSILFQFNFRRIKLHRKELYTSLSLAMAVILSGALINDFVSIIYAEMPERSTHDFTFSLLVSQSYCNVDGEYLEFNLVTKIFELFPCKQFIARFSSSYRIVQH